MKKISGAYLKKLRLENGYSLRSLGEKLYVSKSTVDNWEKKDSLSDRDLIQALANLYNMEVEDLVNQSCPNGQSESSERTNAEAVRLKSRKKVLKIVLSIIAVIFFLGLLTATWIIGIFAFSNTDGFGKISLSGWNIEKDVLFFSCIVCLICIIGIFIFLLLRKRCRKRKSQFIDKQKNE